MELISFKLCPFVQRAVIVLKEHQLDYDINYINLADPPSWFREISPTGKVPLLKVNHQVLFESSVICEYLDEIADNTLHPADPLERAIGRGWVEYGVNCLQTLFHLSTTNDQQRFEQAVASFKEHMIKLDTVISSGPYFYREQFTMADAAFAPIFMRLALIDKWTNLTLFDGVPKVSSWSSQLLNRDSVQHSVVEEFPTLYRKMLESKKGVITSSLN